MNQKTPEPLTREEIVRFYRARAAVQQAKMVEGIPLTTAIRYQDARDEYNRHADMWADMADDDLDRIRWDIIDVETTVANRQ